MRAGFSWSVPV